MGVWDRLRGLFGARTEGANAGAKREARSSRSSGDESGAREALVHVLQTYAKHGTELEEVNADRTRSDCEAWVRHIMTGALPPGAERSSNPTDSTSQDWTGLRRYFSETRKQECGRVAKGMGDLRQAFWAFIRGLSVAIRKDQSGDEIVSTQLLRLRKAVRSNSTEEIKREALAVAETVGKVIEERQARQRLQMNELGKKVRAMSKELEDARARLAIDPLTQLFNRAAFDEQLQRLIDVNTIAGRPACMLMIDIDHFKSINDTHGHTAGDEVLRQIAHCAVRAFPRRTDFVARYGGEEFAVVLQHDDLEVGRKMAQRMLDVVRKLEVRFGAETLRVTVSVGIAELEPGEEAKTWIDRADRALYAAKDQGRDRLVVHAEAEPAVAG